MFLGSSESIGSLDDLFTAIDKRWKIYQRKETTIRFPITKLSLLPVSNHDKPISAQPPSLTSGLQSNQISRQIQKLLLQLYAPVNVVVNEYGKIIYIHGCTGHYLELSSGQPNINIVELAREGLKLPLATALRKIRKASGSGITSKRIRVKTNGDFELIDLKLVQILEPESLRDLIIVSFHPCQAEKVRVDSKQEILLDDKDERGQLEDELYFTKESLRATIEELETSNEELKSANEELQSSNEELETSKEEIQSLNEELNTVNGELRNKVEELSQTNDDMQNLLNATDIATIFLDIQLKIKRFTRQATRLIKLIDTDIGRPLEDLVSTLKYDDLIVDAKRVLQTLVFKDKEVQSINGDWYLLRILPYRTAENMIDGLVITFIDISRLKQAEKMAHEADMTRAIVETVSHPLLVLDSDFSIMAANQAFYRTFYMMPELVEHQNLFTIADGAWNAPELYGSLTKTRDRNISFDGLCYKREFPGAGFKHLILNGCVLTQPTAESPSILLAIEDITDKLDSGKT